MYNSIDIPDSAVQCTGERRGMRMRVDNHITIHLSIHLHCTAPTCRPHTNTAKTPHPAWTPSVSCITPHFTNLSHDINDTSSPAHAPITTSQTGSTRRSKGSTKAKSLCTHVPYCATRIMSCLRATTSPCVAPLGCIRVLCMFAFSRRWHRTGKSGMQRIGVLCKGGKLGTLV
jgi:hypothetical protein